MRLEVWRKASRREATTLYGATQPVSVTHTIKYAGMSLIDSNFIITFSMMTGIWHVMNVLPYVTLDFQSLEYYKCYLILAFSLEFSHLSLHHSM